MILPNIKKLTLIVLASMMCLPILAQDGESRNNDRKFYSDQVITTGSDAGNVQKNDPNRKFHTDQAGTDAGAGNVEKSDPNRKFHSNEFEAKPAGDGTEKQFENRKFHSDMYYGDDSDIVGDEHPNNRRSASFENTAAFTADALSVYPNPATDFFTVQVNAEGVDGVELTVMDLTGKVVATQYLIAEFGTMSTRIETYDLPKGVYLVSVTNGVDRYTQKLIVK